MLQLLRLHGFETAGVVKFLEFLCAHFGLGHGLAGIPTASGGACAAIITLGDRLHLN